MNPLLTLRRAAVVVLLALVLAPAGAVAADDPQGQPAPPQPLGGDVSILSLTVHLTAEELVFEVGPDLRVDVDGVEGFDPMLDTCHFQPGVVYHDVELTLAIEDGATRLTCAFGPADLQGWPGPVPIAL